MSEFILGQYFIALLVTGIINLGLSLFVIYRGFHRRINQVFALYSLSLAVWSIFEAWGITITDKSNALLLWRINHIGVIFIPIFLTHFTFLFLHIKDSRKKFIPISYVIGFIFLILDATPLFISNVVPKFSFRYFINPGILYYPFLALWIGWALYGNVELLKEFFRTTGYRRMQMKYFCWAMLLSYIGGVPNFLPTFNVELPGIMPYGTYAIPLYAIIAAYSIIRYHLMDITLVITSVGIFVLVYALVLGIPFGLAIWGQEWLKSIFNENWYWVHTIILLLLATAGPFIFLYLKRKAESQLLQEERRIEHQLSQASYGMNKVHELNRLLKLIVKLVVKLLRVEKATLYLLKFEEEKYFLMEPIRDRAPNTFIESGNALAQYLIETKFPLVIEEIHMHSLIKNKNVSSKDIEVQMKHLSAHVIVPIAADNTLLGFLALGERKEKKIYRQELLNTLSILGNQAALAIENCQFMEAEKERLKKEGAQARRESLDMMVGTMAHEIDNPLAFVIGEAEYLEFLIKSDQYQLPPEFLAAITKSCGQIISGSWRVSKIIKAVEDYSKAESGQNKAVYIHNVMIPLRSLLLLLGKNYPGIPLTEEIEPELPPMWAEEVTIEEIIYNYVENSYHAVRRLPRGQPWVKLRIYRKEDMIVIEVSDNGYGIEARILKQLFQVPTTTKGSAEGTGLGLYRARQIVDKLKGRAWAESEGRDKGSKFFAEIPIFKGDPALANKEPPRRAF